MEKIQEFTITDKWDYGPYSTKIFRWNHDNGSVYRTVYFPFRFEMVKIEGDGPDRIKVEGEFWSAICKAQWAAESRIKNG